MWLFWSTTRATHSADCTNLQTLAQGMNMGTQQPSIMNSIQFDCCMASGVTCTGPLFSEQVTSISWPNLNLNGNMNSAAWPPALSSMDVSGNKLTGTLPALPSTLTTLKVAGNSFSGSLNIAWPSGLSLLDVSNNAFQCDLSGNWPSSLTELHLNGLSCTGFIPAFLSTLQSLSLGVTSDSSQFNHFSGALTMNKPIKLYINNNWITSVIVTDTSSLTSCDLSNNPLLGDPHLSTLTMCIKNNLYMPPNTISTSVTSRVTSSSTVSSKISSYITLTQSSFSIKSLSTTIMDFSLSISKTTLVRSSTRTSANIVVEERFRHNKFATFGFVSSKRIQTDSSTGVPLLSYSHEIAIVSATPFSLQIRFEQCLRLFISICCFAIILIKAPFKKQFDRNAKLKNQRDEKDIGTIQKAQRQLVF